MSFILNRILVGSIDLKWAEAKENTQQTENRFDIPLHENNYNPLLFIEFFGRISKI
jgi:hypothetical protein